MHCIDCTIASLPLFKRPLGWKYEGCIQPLVCDGPSRPCPNSPWGGKHVVWRKVYITYPDGRRRPEPEDSGFECCVCKVYIQRVHDGAGTEPEE